MLIIRREQIEALGAQARERFIAVMRRHLEASFPERCDALGPDGVRGLIQRGMEKAQGFGLAVEQDVAGLIHFMFEGDPEFDHRPEFVWAVEALRDDRLEPRERLDRLYTLWAECKAAGGAPNAQ